MDLNMPLVNTRRNGDNDTIYFKAGRVWINPIDAGDTGAVHWGVGVYNHSPNAIACNLQIWDCGRKVSLDFDSWGENGAKARAKKLDLLIAELQKMKKALGEAYSKLEFEENDT